MGEIGQIDNWIRSKGVRTDCSETVYLRVNQADKNQSFEIAVRLHAPRPVRLLQEKMEAAGSRVQNRVSSLQRQPCRSPAGFPYPPWGAYTCGVAAIGRAHPTNAQTPEEGNACCASAFNRQGCPEPVGFKATLP